MDNKPKLELRISKRKLASLEVIKQRAKLRTNRRIQMELEEREIKRMERAALEKSDDDMVTVDEEIAPAVTESTAPSKKG